MCSIVEIQKEIITDFEIFESWTEKYEYLIDLGKNLPKIQQKYKTDEFLIKGCQSRVWLHAEEKNGKIIYTADSDAIMTKGIVSLLISVLSHQSPADIASIKLDFIKKIGLQEQLSATRANGLTSMIKQMKLYALIYVK